ncbi:alanine racemase [Brevirhabdus pacifica]|uniref:Alanine racemase n=1 Tax=Brevirhabdus pacifica TaxID=1267768 RepID=A0A1U7DLB4_9RHOB|nr:alanine racemase [Brevirhabdus pacifica]APX90658.1 alanine racemase [Brevirhabdus pacifica]PJJ85196.1 alanine racemase [Brevirhabdus pacifica]
MAKGILSIDLDALVANWRALDRLSAGSVETGAVVKADGYGLNAGIVGKALARAGARRFFVALAEEGAALRQALGGSLDEGPQILVFSGHMAGDAALLRDHGLVPMLNSPEQLSRHLQFLPGHAFGVQLDSGMNRLGMEPSDWAPVRAAALAQGPVLIMSHLACSDEPHLGQNRAQLDTFRQMTEGCNVPRSLSATGGILLGPEYHFDVTRPGVGLYGGAPFTRAEPVVRLSLPVIQVRNLTPGETVGYGGSWTARQPTRIATLSGGYADGITRHLSNIGQVFAGDTPCPLAGRVSMDLLTVDVSALPEVPETLDLICPAQGVDRIADLAGTIGYEVLTQLGHRYERRYLGEAGADIASPDAAGQPAPVTTP